VCLILVAWRVHADYPLVVAANRDEFFARPTLAADFWTDAPAVLGGRDLEAGGTWLGCTHSGRFAALTNFRDPAGQRAGLPSRGQLTSDFLLGESKPMAYLQHVASRAVSWNGFNLLVGDSEQLCCFSNVSGIPHLLAPGVYGLSNHLLDTPWPKVAAAKSAMVSALDTLPDQSLLLALLYNKNIHRDDQLPQTGVSLQWERILSAAFVIAPDYGTRCSTVLLRSRDDRITFDELTWLPGARSGARARFCFGLKI
jgi:uncharacterized protein with NRDE domain